MVNSIPLTKTRSFICRNYFCVILFLWTLSILIGIYISHIHIDDLLPLMHSLPIAPVSIVRYLFVECFPLFIAAIAVCWRSYVFFAIITPIKGFILGYFMFAATTVFGSAGWLVVMLLSLPDHISTVFAFYFIQERNGKDKGRLAITTFLSVVAVAAAVFIEYYFISPLLELLY